LASLPHSGARVRWFTRKDDSDTLRIYELLYRTEGNISAIMHGEYCYVGPRHLYNVSEESTESSIEQSLL
jgi:hypothetical protein